MRTRMLLLLHLLALAATPLASYGACSINNTPSNDTSTCDSGSTPGFVDTGGNNSLTVSGTGQVSGSVTFGAGNDRTEINGPGAKIVGGLSQGAGIDDFIMSSGEVKFVDQGDGLDTFRMTGGVIVDEFSAGDYAVMTGGTIGNVNMRLDDNTFLMSGGKILRNLITGFGTDLVRLSGDAEVVGNISVSGGDDTVEILGGKVGGNVLLSAGNDKFLWSGGTLGKLVDAGLDDDIAVLRNLTDANLAKTILDGSLGNDKLIVDNSRVSNNPDQYVNWETVNLTNGTTFTLEGKFVLGDSASNTGTLTIDKTSAILTGTGFINSLGGKPVTLDNQGLIDMTGNTRASDSLTVSGIYKGNGGRLALQSVLGADGSASDKLVVNGGPIQGTTPIDIKNLNGAGAQTVQNGILVVEAINNASGAASAFSLGKPVSAGAYDYYLFKGGVTAGTSENFYLRSTVPAKPTDPVITPVPTPDPEGPPLPPNPGITPLPIYRPEVSVYAVLFPAAQQMVQDMLGTYHERMGDQSQQQQTGAFPAGWGRVYGNSRRQGFAGTVSPSLKSSVSGFQIGSDVYAGQLDNGLQHRVGFFVGHSTLKGNVKGFSDARLDQDTGKTTLRGDSLGLYWTLIGANQAYLDLVLMGTRFDGHNESDRGVKMKTRGHNLTASAEVGWPLPISDTWVVEPQAQVIVGKTRLDQQNDGISDVSYDADTSLTTRLGVRLRGDYQVSGMPLQPYARANVWHTRAGQNTVRFDDVTDIDTEQKSTTLGLSAGATLKVATGVSVYSEVGSSRNLDSNTFNGRQGTLGLRMEF